MPSLQGSKTFWRLLIELQKLLSPDLPYLVIYSRKKIPSTKISIWGAARYDSRIYPPFLAKICGCNLRLDAKAKLKLFQFRLIFQGSHLRPLSGMMYSPTALLNQRRFYAIFAVPTLSALSISQAEFHRVLKVILNQKQIGTP